MKPSRVRVENGRVSGEAPTATLISAWRTPEAQMSDDELARLNEVLVKGFEAIEAGRFRSAADVIADLRRG